MSFVSAPPLPQRRSYWRRFCRCTPSAELYRRALAVDYGLARVGVAISLGFSARPLRALQVDSPRAAARGVDRVARAEGARDIVVGLPLNAKGEEGEQAKLTREFCEALVDEAKWATLWLIDERFTTQIARAVLKGRGVAEGEISAVVDSQAAAAIADRFFDEAGEVKPILLHRPQLDLLAERAAKRGGLPEEGADEGTAGDEGTMDSMNLEHETFFTWKQNAMARAAETQLELGEKGHGRRRKKKRRGKTN